MLLEYWELGRSELNTPGDMGGEKNDRVAGDPNRRLRVKADFAKTMRLEQPRSGIVSLIHALLFAYRKLLDFLQATRCMARGY